MQDPWVRRHSDGLDTVDKTFALLTILKDWIDWISLQSLLMCYTAESAWRTLFSEISFYLVLPIQYGLT